MVDQKLEECASELHPLAMTVDKLWVGLRMAFDAAARLEGTETGERGARLVRLVFPQGTKFVTQNHRAQWLVADRILARIERLGLEPDIVTVAGPEYLPRIRELHARYADRLGTGSCATKRPSRRAIARAIGELADAIADYGRLMAGITDHEDEDAVDVFLNAMEPLESYRTRAFGARRTNEEAGEIGDADDDDVDDSAGATEDVPTEDGATEDGATEDGATEDGATEGGATEDGATSADAAAEARRITEGPAEPTPLIGESPA